MSALQLDALGAKVRVEVPEHLDAVIAEALADFRDREAGSADVPDLRIVWVAPTGDADGASDDHDRDGGWKLRVADTERPVLDLGEALSASLIEVNRAAAACAGADHAVLHAGAFEVGGSAVAVTGASGAGKSTLVAAAMLAGHGYLADEVCAIALPDRSVRPYHRPIGLRASGAAALGVPIPARSDGLFKEVYPWPVAGHATLVDGAELQVVAFVDRRPGPTEIVPVGEADALVRLTTVSLGADGVEREMFRRFDRLVREVECVTVSFEDSVEAVEALAGLVR